MYWILLLFTMFLVGCGGSPPKTTPPVKPALSASGLLTLQFDANSMPENFIQHPNFPEKSGPLLRDGEFIAGPPSGKLDLSKGDITVSLSDISIRYQDFLDGRDLAERPKLNKKDLQAPCDTLNKQAVLIYAHVTRYQGEDIVNEYQACVAYTDMLPDASSNIAFADVRAAWTPAFAKELRDALGHDDGHFMGDLQFSYEFTT